MTIVMENHLIFDVKTHEMYVRFSPDLRLSDENEIDREDCLKVKI